MPITASYIAAQFKLRVLGTSSAESVTVSRNGGGTLFVNGGAVPITSGPSTIANTTLIQVEAGAAADVVTLDESNGALPAAMLYGGSGNDTLTGGSGGDTLYGEGQNDTLSGKGGNDLLYGGTGNDILTGGDGDDQMFGEDGNDRMIWNPGDDSDLMEGGIGTDTAEVNGGNGAETFAITANGTRVRFDRLDPAPFSLDIGTTETLVLNAGGGDDRISATGNLAALIAMTLDGGTGNDIILGGNGNDQLFGGDGNDAVDGNQGNDTAFLGAGNDIFQWDPGDGNDVIEGQGDIDTLVFNGSAAAESFTFSKNGGRVVATRNVGAITLDLNDVERLTINAAGSNDTITINDLSGTDVTQVDVDLAGTIGGSGGDGAFDVVSVTGTSVVDTIVITSVGTNVSVAGLPVAVNVSNVEGANDTVAVNGGSGNDTINASTIVSGAVRLNLAGGIGNDTILGSANGDTIFGDDGNDVIEGNQGNDTAFLGVGNDVFQWDPGDGSDIVEGQAGTDELRFNGANIAENIGIVANGGRVLVTRDVAAVTMDLDDVEKLVFRALNGIDNFTIGDLSGTDVTQIEVRLASGGGGGDGASDTVTVTGSAVTDSVTLSSPGGVVKVSGLSAAVSIFDSEGANDQLTVNLGSGDDTLTAAGLAVNRIKLTINGGLGNDVLTGSAGNDLINGGDGNDTAFLGSGDDNFVWNPGDDNDVVEGQGGVDTLTFNGANITENITISANGARILFTRDVAAVSMDLNDIETIRYSALGGADTITVNDLSGTDAKNLILDLASTPGGASGDGQVDTIVLSGDPGNETIVATSLGGGAVNITGLPATVAFNALETADRLTILGGNGTDSISAATITAAVAVVTLDGGDGNDTLYSGGDGTYLGGIGNDTVFAGLTSVSEIIDGGTGVDTLDTTSWGGTYTINLVTGTTNYSGESFTNFENLTTGAGDDTVTGTDVANIIKTNAGVDSLFGADGNDTLDGGAGADSMNGGLGNDIFHVDNASDIVIEGVADGTSDQIFASVSYTQGAGVYVEKLSTKDDSATTAINLTGNELANIIRGNAGANILDGKGGKDTLTGSVGADIFRFTTALGPSNIDRITDYDVANDLIQIDNAVFSGLPGGALAPGAFRLGAAAADATDRIIYNSATGALLFDADGNGAGAAVQFATLSTGLGMSAAEFVVI